MSDWHADGKLQPESAQAWAGRASDLLQRGEFQEAARCFRKALKHGPDYSLAWTGLGLALLNAGNYQGALNSLDKALKLPFFLTDNWVFRAEALVRLGRYQEAVDSYEKAINGGMKDRETWSGIMEALSLLDQYVRERWPKKTALDLYDIVTTIEERLHLFVRGRLKRVFGERDEQWWAQGIPINLRKKCAERVEEDPERKHPYHYTDLIDLKDILDKNWKHFEADFDLVKREVKRKNDFLDGLVRLNKIRNTVMHPVRGSATKDDLEFARQMRDQIERCLPAE